MSKVRTGVGPSPFGKWLSDELDRRRMSQADLAQRVGVTANSISRWMRAGRTPRTDVVKRIAFALGIPQDEALVVAGLIPPGAAQVGERAHLLDLIARLPDEEVRTVLDFAEFRAARYQQRQLSRAQTRSYTDSQVSEGPMENDSDPSPE